MRPTASGFKIFSGLIVVGMLVVSWGLFSNFGGQIAQKAGEQLVKAGKLAQQPADVADAQALPTVATAAVVRAATGQTATSFDITASNASVADVKTPDVKINMFGTSFSEPGKTFPALSGDETAYLTNLKREIGLNIVRAKGHIATSRAVAKQLGYEMTESQILEVAAALKGLSDDFAGLVGDSHAGPTQQKINTIWDMHTGDGLQAVNLRVTRNVFVANRKAPNAYLVEFEINGEFVKAEDVGIRAIVQLPNNKTVHNLGVNVIFAMAPNTEHNSEPLTSLYVAASVMQSGKKISANTSEISAAPAVTDLKLKEAIGYLTRKLGVTRDGAKWLLGLDKK